MEAGEKLRPLAKSPPSSSEACSELLALPASEVLASVVRVLQLSQDANDGLLNGKRQDPAHTTRFHTKNPINVSLEAYLTRLVKLTPLPLDALVVAIIYINRITQLKIPGSNCQFMPLFRVLPKRSIIDIRITSSDPPPPLTSYTCHRLLLAALSLAASYSSDAYIAPVRGAKVGGISVQELHALRLELFGKLSYDCVVTDAELEQVCRSILQQRKADMYPAEAQSMEMEIDVAQGAVGCSSPHQEPGTPPLSEDDSEGSYLSSDAMEDVSGAERITSTASKEHTSLTPTLVRTSLSAPWM